MDNTRRIISGFIMFTVFIVGITVKAQEPYKSITERKDDELILKWERELYNRRLPSEGLERSLLEGSTKLTSPEIEALRARIALFREQFELLERERQNSTISQAEFENKSSILKNEWENFLNTGKYVAYASVIVAGAKKIQNILHTWRIAQVPRHAARTAETRVRTLKPGIDFRVLSVGEKTVGGEMVRGTVGTVAKSGIINRVIPMAIKFAGPMAGAYAVGEEGAHLIKYPERFEKIRGYFEKLRDKNRAYYFEQPVIHLTECLEVLKNIVYYHYLADEKNVVLKEEEIPTACIQEYGKPGFWGRGNFLLKDIETMVMPRVAEDLARVQEKYRKRIIEDLKKDINDSNKNRRK